MNELRNHPASELFPMMSAEEHQALKDDIQTNGLHQAIVICDGLILDGRNRYRVCQELGIEPRFETYSGESPVSYVWSLNGARRHLEPAQKATIALRMMPELREEARKRQEAGQKAGGRGHTKTLGSRDPGVYEESESGRAREHAARMVGVGEGTLQRVEYVAKRDPELYKKLESGEMKANTAVNIIKAREPEAPRQQPAAVRIEQIRALADTGHRATQIAAELGIGEEQVRKLARDGGITLPDAVIGRAHLPNTQRIITETVHGLSGYALGLRSIPLDLTAITRADAKEWLVSLSDSMAVINRLRRQLSEISNG